MGRSRSKDEGEYTGICEYRDWAGVIMVYIGVDKIKNYKEGQGDMAYLRE